MSRDRYLDVPHEHGRQTQADAGRDVPRAGRSGGATRRPAKPSGELRDALSRQLALPRGESRERVSVGQRTYALRASEVRTLATVGAFRVIDTCDLTEDRSRWHGDLEHLRQERLVQFTSKVLDGRSTTVASLTREGQQLLERYQRTEVNDARQGYYSGVVKPRELAHDARLYRAYADAAAKLDSTGARVQRVVLDYELKREYQRFLQANNHANRSASGRPDRSADEVRAWADEHGLTVVDGGVQFPDVRIEFEDADGRPDREDIEVATEHYSTRQIAAKRAAGFQMHGSSAGRLGGGSGRSGASPFDPHAAEEVLR